MAKPLPTTITCPKCGETLRIPYTISETPSPSADFEVRVDSSEVYAHIEAHHRAEPG